MPNRFCAICGKKLDKDSPHIGMCLNCYSEEHPLFDLPNKFTINVCIDCGSYSKKDVWFKPSEDDLFSILSETVQKFLLKSLMKNNQIDLSFSFNENSLVYSSKDLLKSVEVLIKGILKGNSNVKHQMVVQLILNHILCKNCSNIRGGTYFISILQLRVNDESQYDFIQKILEEINNFTENLFKKDHRQYITKVEDQKYGIDLYLSTNEIMNHIIKYLRSHHHFLLKRTKKLVGRDNQKGKNLYRLKASIKFLPVSLNDRVLINDEDYIVESITKRKIILRSKTNTKLIKDYSFFFNEKVYHKK
ncbi:MAG: NMD3-related protein [Promethearchaeota archaeon]|jgi:NMD protein affecting ribosome stability and mRNA decay